MRKDELETYLDNAQLPPAGRRYVRDSCRLAPIRDAHGGNTSVPTDIHSKKGAALPGATRPVRTESMSVEYAVAQMYEADSQVLEWYAQPLTLDVSYVHPVTESTVRWQHHPDFLVLCRERPLIEEWKGLNWLKKQLKTKPGRYQFEDGVWYAPAVEKTAEALGLAYRLRTHDDVPRLLTANTKFLLRYMDDAWPRVEDKKLEAIRAAFDGRPYIKFANLLRVGSGHECIDQEATWEFDSGSEEL